MTSTVLPRHPDHDRLANEVRSWYESAYPDMGYRVERRRFGVYSVNVNAPQKTARVTVRGVRPGNIPELLADAKLYFGGGPIWFMLDDPGEDLRLGPLLIASGCRQEQAEVFLVHVGTVPPVPSIPALSIEPVTPANLVDFAITKIRGFSDNEAMPAPEDIQQELALRHAEMAGEGRFSLARINTDPAAILGWYEGGDRLIFLVATRVPYRGKGIATALLCHLLREAHDTGCRSVIINADPAGLPVHLYRSLGFLDEVYWRRFYLYSAD